MGLFENSHFPYTNFHEMNMDKLVEICEGSAGQAQALSTRMTAAEQDIDTLENRADGTDNQISLIHGRLSTDENDIDTLEARADSADSRISTNAGKIAVNESDIDALETRLTGDEATITAQGVTLAEKSTVGVTQVLDAGVNIANIEIDGLTTRIYAPTAGSTYVRAVDVPYDNTDSGMAAQTVQAAVDELHTDYLSLDGFVGGAVYTPTQVVTDAEGAVFAGYIYGGSKNIAFMIPWIKAFDSRYPSPVSNPNNFTATLQGNLYVRGITGALLSNVNVASPDISNITITPAACGAMIVVTLANALSVTNNTPLTVTMTNGAFLRFTYVAP